MSFIYAEKYQMDDSSDESVRVLCDTKTSPGRYTSANLSRTEYDLVLKYGVVKSTICCPELCISFAGNNTLFAAKLFRELDDMGSFEPKDVSDYALSIHQSAPSSDDIEFIISYFSNDQVFIDCVKNRKLQRNCTIAHIGSEDAFKAFQKARLSAEKHASSLTESAFRDVVSGCKDDTVGGRTVKVIFDFQSKSFIYNWERAFHTSKPQIVSLGEPIAFNTSASDGGYSYEIVHGDIENVFYIIDQMNYAILYSRKYRIDSKDKDNPNLFGLMLPMLVDIDKSGDTIQARFIRRPYRGSTH